MSSRGLFGTGICTFLLLATSSTAALGQNGPADCRLPAGNGQDSPPPFSQPMADQPSCAGCSDPGPWESYACPRWTASADCLILDRFGGNNQKLVEKVPAYVPPDTPGNEVLNGTGFEQGFRGGPRLDLIRHDDCGYDLEVSCFQITDWNSDRNIGPGNPADWLVMKAPGGFLQTNQHFTQAMDWQYGTNLYGAELNVRWDPCSAVTMLAGFRWVGLHEDLVGALAPPTIRGEPPFWTTMTSNNLYGFQIGTDGKILDRGRFSIDGLIKAGIFDNNAEQTTFVSVIAKQIRWASASTNQAAFVGETGLQCKYQVTDGLSLRAGYELIWLDGVALAPGQVQETYVTISPKRVQALGVDSNSGVFFHGAIVGLEYSF